MTTATTLSVCKQCKSTCGESDRFCPSCGSNQFGVISPENSRNPHPGQLVFDGPTTPVGHQENPIANHVGYATHLNVVPNQGPAYVPPAQTINVNVSTPGMAVQEDDSYTFAFLTLLAYFFIFPVGAIMNLIGLFCGPKRGCFAAMLFLILIPTVCLSAGLLLIGLIAAASGA